MNERMLKPIIDVVAPMFPALGTALAGPIGGIVGDLIAHIFGVPMSDPVTVASKIQSDPDAKVKLASINYSHEEALFALANQAAATDNLDVQNARSRELEELKLTGKHDIFLPILAIVITLGFFIMVALMVGEKIDPAAQPILYTLLGVLGAGFTQLISYYFGSSHKK